MKASDDPVVVEQSYDAPIDELWQSLTAIDKMSRWYFENIPTFNPEVGFETRFNVHSDGRDFLHIWKVTEVIPQQLISYEWRYEGYTGKSTSIFELFDKGGSTLLKLTVVVHEDFPDDIPEFRRESCVAGWEFFLKGRLKEFLKGE